MSELKCVKGYRSYWEDGVKKSYRFLKGAVLVGDYTPHKFLSKQERKDYLKRQCSYLKGYKPFLKSIAKRDFSLQLNKLSKEQIDSVLYLSGAVRSYQSLLEEKLRLVSIKKKTLHREDRHVFLPIIDADLKSVNHDLGRVYYKIKQGLFSL